MAEVPVAVPVDSRSRLEIALSANANAAQVAPASRRSRLLSFGPWGMAAAACLIATLMVVPRFSSRQDPVQMAGNAAATATFEVDGETFVALPYSNPALPPSNSRIVEMQVPWASLAHAGLVVESAPEGRAGGSVLADVLLGADGEPLGVHVLSEP